MFVIYRECCVDVKMAVVLLRTQSQIDVQNIYCLAFILDLFIF